MHNRANVIMNIVSFDRNTSNSDRSPAGGLLKLVGKGIDKEDKWDKEGSYWWKRVVATDKDGR